MQVTIPPDRQIAFQCARAIARGKPIREAFGTGARADMRRAELRQRLRERGIGSRAAYDIVRELFTP